MTGLRIEECVRLRRVFLHKRERYSPSEAAEVLGIPRAHIVGMIEQREIDAATRVSTTHHLPWLSIAELALDRYAVTDLIEALGEEAASVLPPLLYPSESPLQVMLPGYLARLVEHRASKYNVTVDAYLAELLRGYALELIEPNEVEEAIPGFTAALLFPNTPKEVL
jgi:hypothetical protein